MKTIVSPLIALSVLSGIAASASAFDTKGFYHDLDRRSGGTANWTVEQRLKRDGPAAIGIVSQRRVLEMRCPECHHVNRTAAPRAKRRCRCPARHAGRPIWHPRDFAGSAEAGSRG
jgi:hypothetical protein